MGWQSWVYGEVMRFNAWFEVGNSIEKTLFQGLGNFWITVHASKEVDHRRRCRMFQISFTEPFRSGCVGTGDGEAEVDGLGISSIHFHVDEGCPVLVRLGDDIQGFDRDPWVRLEDQRKNGVPLGDFDMAVLRFARDEGFSMDVIAFTDEACNIDRFDVFSSEAK